MSFSQETIDEVRSRNDIVDVIGQYVQLKRAGSSYMGLCPFHSEKTPSFSVSPSKQIFHCFGCGKGGNVITFVMEEERLSFPEAVRFLADRAGMHIEETAQTPGQQEEARRRREREETLLAVNREAAYFYVGQLATPDGARGLRYLHDRHLTDETIRAWGLGFAPGTGHALYDHLKENREYLFSLKEHFVSAISQVEGIHVNGLTGEDSAPHIVSVSFQGVRAEVLLHALEDKGIYVSSGSACSSNRPAVSRTLTAIHVEKEYLDETLRFSFSVHTTVEEIDYAIDTIKSILPILRKYTRH